jgi:2-polyprenyl-3-methyl-5-hydroxy-6-metoxy-1,4-benzoquinol methylase
MVTDVVEKVKAKREFRNIDDNFVQKVAAIAIAKRKRTNEEVVKEARALLRKVIVPMPSKFYRKLEKYKAGSKERQQLVELVKMNRATREREEAGIYPWLISLIKSLQDRTGSKELLDFGCGLNLIALWLHGLDFDGLNYVGYDVDKAIVEVLNSFAKNFGLNARAYCCDVTELLKELLKEKRNAIMLFLKIVDGLEEIEPGVSEKIVELGGVKIVSFALRSWGGKKIKQRLWFEKMLERKGLKYEKFVKGNEVFYVFD